MKYTYFAWLLFIPFLIACAEETPEKRQSVISPVSISCLLLKKELLLEIWMKDSLRQEKVVVFPLENEVNFPPGRFELQLEKDQVYIQLDNDFYRQKGQSEGIISKTFPAPPDLLQLIFTEDRNQLIKLIQQAIAAELLIFPNDARKNGSFIPCINCPRWTPELYSSLQLTLSDFKTKNSSK